MMEDFENLGEIFFEQTWSDACSIQIDLHDNRLTPEEHDNYLKLIEEMSQVDPSDSWVTLMVKLLAKKFGFTKYELTTTYNESGEIFREIVFPEDNSVLKL